MSLFAFFQKAVDKRWPWRVVYAMVVITSMTDRSIESLAERQGIPFLTEMC